jgi:hypothetical protein
MLSSYQVVLWKQESFGVLRPLQIEFFRSLLAWIIHPVSSQKRKDALKGMMNTGFTHPAFPFGASIA